MVDNYKIECKYHLGDLENILYLQYFEDKIRYKIDENGFPICQEIEGDIFSIECSNVQLTENSIFDNKFSFQYTLTATFNEGNTDIYEEILKILRNKQYRIIVKTKEGLLYLVNAEYPYTLNYEYSWNNTNHSCILTFKSNNNIPTMKYSGNILVSTPLIPNQCIYFNPYVKEFDIIENNSVFVEDNTITLIGNNNWKTIEPLNNSFSYTHNFNGESFTDEIVFQIELSDYKTTFHYNIIEFAKNKYTVKFKSSNGNIIVVKDLFPSFSLNTSENNTNINTITITLRNSTSIDKVKSSDFNEITDSTKKEAGLTDDRKEYTEFYFDYNGNKYQAVECVSPTMAKRLILPQIGKDGNETNRYYVLEGYETYFSFLGDKIIDTYNDYSINEYDISLYVYSNFCEHNFGCLYRNSLNDVNYIINSNNYSFNIYSSCGWEIIEKSDCIELGRMIGETKKDYNVSVSSNCDFNQDSYIKIKVGDDEYIYRFIRVNTRNCFIDYDYVFDNGEEAVVSSFGEVRANSSSHTITFNLRTIPTNININNPQKVDLYINKGTLVVNIPENKSNDRIEYEFNLDDGNSAFCDVVILQDAKTEDWRLDTSKYECEGLTKYYLERLYIDNIPTDTYRRTSNENFIVQNSFDCTKKTLVKWVDTGDYYCEEELLKPYEMWSASTIFRCDIDHNKISLEYLMVSDDGENWEQTTYSREGDIIEDGSESCGACKESVRWSQGEETVCEGKALYYVEEEELNTTCGEHWVKTGNSRKGTKISDNSDECEGIETIKITIVSPTETECIENVLYEVLVEEISYDGGLTWEKTGKKNRGKAIGICGIVEPLYKWEDSQTDTLCYNDGLYKKSYRYKSDDGGLTWVKTGESRRGELIELNSSQCKECTLEYKWVETPITSCSGYNKTVLKKHYFSNDCWITENYIDGGDTYFVIEENSCDCGYVPTKLVEDTTKIFCDGLNEYSTMVEYEQLYCNAEWTTTGIEYKGNLIKQNSENCGYEESFYAEVGIYCGDELPENVIVVDDIPNIQNLDTIVTLFGNADDVLKTIKATEILTNDLFGNLYHPDIKKVEIGYSVNRIDKNVFRNFINLYSVIIPDSVTSIGSEAFYNTKLTELTYKGTIEQWNAITKDECWKCTRYGSSVIKTIKCTDGDIKL